MTKVSESSTVVAGSTRGGSLPSLVYPLEQTSSLGGALHVAGEGAIALAQGSATVGMLLGRKALELTKELVTQARRARENGVPLLKAAVAEKPQKRTRSGRKALIVAGAVGTIAAGGVVFYRSRRPSHPPVAPEPPRVSPIAADTARTSD